MQWLLKLILTGGTLIVNKLKENVGIGKVRDIGIEIATGKYLMFVDSDDYAHPQIVATCVEAMERNECQLVEVNSIRTSKFSIDFENITRPKYRIEEELRIEECSDHVCWGKLYITDIRLCSKNEVSFIPRHGIYKSI